MSCFILVILIFLELLQIEAVEDYCSPDLCPKGVTHIACKHDMKFGPNCARTAKLTYMDEDLVTLVVNQHNRIRNSVAGGDFCLLKATRMATMSWDKELARLAGLSTRSCGIETGKCLNTRRFPHVGQNSAYKQFTTRPNVTEATYSAIDSWFCEKSEATKESIKSYPTQKHGKPSIEHFAQMIQEGANRIGCSILTQSRNEWFQYYLICNYASGNKIGQPVYKSGDKIASDCKTGRNPNFPNLCSNSEIYGNATQLKPNKENDSDESDETKEIIIKIPSPDKNPDKKSDKNSDKNPDENLDKSPDESQEDKNEKDKNKSPGALPKAFENFLNSVSQHVDKFKNINVSVDTHGQEHLTSDRVRFSTKTVNNNPAVRDSTKDP